MKNKKVENILKELSVFNELDFEPVEHVYSINGKRLGKS